MTIVIDHESLVTATLTYAPSDSGNDAQTLRHDSLNRHHIFSLDDLEPDTEYRYSIETAHSDYNSGERTFRTLPTRPSKYRVIAMGDVRSHPEVWHRVSRQIFENEIQALFMVGTGDYPQDGTRYGQWVEQFFQPGRDLLGRMPLWPAIGNHERTRQFTSEPPGEDDPQSHYFSLFELPGNEHWYRVDYRFLTLLIVDSNSQMAPGFQQYEWLREQLTSSRERFTIVAFHHPPITSGPHGQLLPDGTPREWPMDQGRRFLVPLFEMYGVDLVLNGHDHIYERSYKDGVYYLITGGGGAGLYSINVAPNPYQQVARAVHHYATIDVESNMLTVAAVGVDGKEVRSIHNPGL